MTRADVALLGGRIVDVHGRRVVRGDVAIAGGRIAAVGDVDRCVDTTTTVHDCAGRYVLPGLIDPHCHVAFSQLSIERLAELLLPMGTVALSGCLSESAAIVGFPAVDDQLDRAQAAGLDVLLSPFYIAALGAGRLSADEFRALVRDERCVELREWSVRAHRRVPPELRAAYDDARRAGKVIAGHLQGQTDDELQASAALGVRSDHEATSAAEALERLRLGIMVQIRQGSAGRDLEQVLPAITEHGADPAMFAFCSDEQELADLLVNGHMNGKMRHAVRRGLDPLDAVRMASLGAARSMGIEADYGAVVPGRLASLAVVDDLAGFEVAMTFSRGRLVARDGRYTGDRSEAPYPEAWSDTVRLARPLTADDFRLGLPDGRAHVRVIGMTPGGLRSEQRIRGVEVVDGGLADAGGLAKLAVADRLQASGRLVVGLVDGLGIARGAVASTVNPGFNLVVAGADEPDMAVAANRVAELHGGTVVVRDGGVVAEVALPLFGMVSHAPLEDTGAAAEAVARALREELGSPVEALVPCAGFACLPGIGVLKLTDAGLVSTPDEGEPAVVDLAVPTAVN